MNILITGATGNVGRIPFEYLSTDKENKVVGISSKTEGNGIEKFDLATADEEQITNLIERHQIDSVVHFAAILKMTTIPEKEFTSRAIEKFLSNPKGKDLKYVVIGSVAEYGPQTAANLDENTPELPTSDYGKEKLNQTRICQKYIKEGMDITVLRLLNVIAPHLPPGSFVGSTLDAMKKGSSGEININSQDIERDLLDLRDLSLLVEKILKSEKKPDIYNVGSGKNINYGEFLKICFSYIPLENRPVVNILGGIEPLNKTVAIIDKVENAFNWMQKYTLEESIKWCLKENNLIEE
ncbi:NAD-dependent epimerase/dehydratase family protein [Flavobacterium sp.]|uniref:NAD-dependent epimerase/dehydratase family protein n=1 Tax=Flavobacterium sp. TaxID=239 RepID=UPI003267648F